MTTSPSIEAICDLLKLAQQQTDVVVTIDGRPNVVEMNDPDPPESCWQARSDMDRYLGEATWKTTGPGFERLREWVESHWSTDKDHQTPSGTIPTGQNWGVQSENQLDDTTAARKLIVAAKLYGIEAVAKYADQFAAHGLVEVRRHWLLKGQPIESAKPLDDYCTLLPYDEALREIAAQSDPGDISVDWPDRDADNVCALRERYFERVSPSAVGKRRYASPLLTDGAHRLVLLLGLVWGDGFRVVGNWRGVPSTVAAVLPYRLSQGPGAASWPVDLTMKGFGPPPRKRPLAVGELRALATCYSEHPEHARLRLRRAMTRLRNFSERLDDDDRVIDLGIALDTLFIEDGEREDRETLIPLRAAWLYADTVNERRETEAMLRRFLDRNREVLGGRGVAPRPGEDHDRDARLPVETETVTRTCLKTLVVDGWPARWSDATEPSALRLDPHRTASEIPSVKADSLSWSVEDQREIDRALEAVWKTVIEEAPLPPNPSPTTVPELDPKLIERYRHRGIPYVVTHPARLYSAHPKWPRTASEPLDERTAYYCERDVVRHTRLWREAALNKGLVQVEAPTDPNLYHPKDRDTWQEPLLSSHEDNLGVGAGDRRTTTGNAPDTQASKAVDADDDRYPPGAEDECVAPPSDPPHAVAAGLEREWPRLWEEFRHDVNVRTNSLLYLLESIHSRHLAERWRLGRAKAGSADAVATLKEASLVLGADGSFPTYPKLRAFPVLTGEPLLGPHGARRANGGFRVQGMGERRLRPLGEPIPNPAQARSPPPAGSDPPPSGRARRLAAYPEQPCFTAESRDEARRRVAKCSDGSPRASACRFGCSMSWTSSIRWDGSPRVRRPSRASRQHSARGTSIEPDKPRSPLRHSSPFVLSSTPKSTFLAIATKRASSSKTASSDGLRWAPSTTKRQPRPKNEPASGRT